MKRIDARIFVVLAALALAPACRSTAHAAEVPAAPAEHAHEGHGAAAPVAAEPNRDAHGNPDVAKYISSLESEKRVAEMRPEFVVASIALARDAWVADLGCGPGVFALEFASACPDGVVFAVDVEPRQLDRLRERLLANRVANVVPVLASPSDPHLPPGRLDCVFIADTYHHFRDRVDYMRRLKAALKPDGVLAMFEYKPGPLPVGPPANHKLKEGELARELTEAGYELARDFASHEYHDFQLWKPRR
jgi:SAM-dependent methyltransferase